MKSRIFFLFLMLGSLGLSAQKLQVGACFAPDYDWFMRQRLNYGFNYNFRLGFFAEINPVDRIGIRGGVFPSMYGATNTNAAVLLGWNNSVQQFSRLDMDLTAELHYYIVEINSIVVKAIGGMNFPANVYERVFFSNQSLTEQNGLNFWTPEIMVGPGATWNSGKNFNTYVEFLYRRALNAFRPFSVATIELRLGLSWDILAKN